MLDTLRSRRLALAVSLACVCGSAGAASADVMLRLPDHYEFDAQFAAAFRADAKGLHPIRLMFDYPAGGATTVAAWQVDVLSPRGAVLRTWTGEAPLADGRGSDALAWDGRDAAGRAVPDGYYTIRLRSAPAIVLADELRQSVAERVATSFRLAAADELIEQREDVMVGDVAAPVLSPFVPLRRGDSVEKAAAPGALPYTIYYGNLHSQTNHSDGGTPVGDCGGSEVPQGGTMGPAEAYAMMDVQAGGDFLLASEHNHMYDGSTGTNANANPATANGMFASGRSAADAYTAAHPGFLALYGNEWGVISNGGHLNIINPDVLPSWEYTSSNQLIGGVATIKSNYADLYAVMKQRGWIGQFNHPSTSQFAINGTAMAFDANGADVMVASEIRNSSAFSTSTNETGNLNNPYESGFKLLLERGYKVAPTSNQDNHCANWGLSFRNRTGVLLPNGAELTHANFIDALKARRVFATDDKNAQLVLTANGEIMGRTIANSGALTLTVNYASTAGGTVQRVQYFEGVPGRNGTVTERPETSGTITFTPSAGAHFYYVKVTEADNDVMWSAPVWVNQSAGVDAAPPTVAASATGASGTITLSANASDDVGVTNVEFYVDGVLKGSDASAPYSITLDSTTLADGAHELTAKAFDAVGNSTLSAGFAFSIDNSTDAVPPTVTASASGTSGTITLSAASTDNVGVTRVEFYVDGALKGDDTSSPYALALDSTTLTNGSHALTAKAYDAAGNSATSTPAAFTVTNAAPDTAAPSVTASVSGNRGTITLQAAASDNVGVTQVDFAVDGTVLGSDTTAPYSLSIDSTLLADGDHGLTATAYDAAGNDASSDIVFQVDNIDTLAPTVSATAIGSSGTIALSANASDDTGVTLVEFLVDGTPVGSDATAPYTFALDSTALANGDHVLTARASDAAGNAKVSPPFAFTVSNADVTAPAVTASVSGTSGMITLSATASDDIGVTRVHFLIDGVPSGSDSTAPYAATFDSRTLSNGSHVLTARAFDAAGNDTTSSAVDFTIANTPPEGAPTVSASVSRSGTTLTFTAAATDDVGVTAVEFHVDGLRRGVDDTAPFAMTLDAGTLENGKHVLTARAYDAALNSTTSAPVEFNVDNTPIDSKPPSVNAWAQGTRGMIMLGADASDEVGVAYVELYVDGVLATSDSTAPFTLSMDSTTIGNGMHRVAAKAFDTSGNSAWSSATSFRVANGDAIFGTGFED